MLAEGKKGTHKEQGSFLLTVCISSQKQVNVFANTGYIFRGMQLAISSGNKSMLPYAHLLAVPRLGKPETPTYK